MTTPHTKHLSQHETLANLYASRHFMILPRPTRPSVTACRMDGRRMRLISGLTNCVLLNGLDPFRRCFRDGASAVVIITTEATAAGRVRFQINRRFTRLVATRIAIVTQISVRRSVTNQTGSQFLRRPPCRLGGAKRTSSSAPRLVATTSACSYSQPAPLSSFQALHLCFP